MGRSGHASCSSAAVIRGEMQGTGGDQRSQLSSCSGRSKRSARWWLRIELRWSRSAASVPTMTSTNAWLVAGGVRPQLLHLIDDDHQLGCFAQYADGPRSLGSQPAGAGRAATDRGSPYRRDLPSAAASSRMGWAEVRTSRRRRWMRPSRTKPARTRAAFPYLDAPTLTTNSLFERRRPAAYIVDRRDSLAWARGTGADPCPGIEPTTSVTLDVAVRSPN